jgi:hypothetical protein
MSLSGSGALGVWHCVEEGFEKEVEHWYINEHYHDRVVIEGFLRARNYRNLRDRGSLYFSRYDTVDVNALACPEYLHSLRNPSPWSQKIFPHYRNTIRGAFDVVQNWRIGAGGYLLSLRMDDGAHGLPRDLRQEMQDAIPRLKKLRGVVAIESWLVNAGISTIKTTEQAIRGQQDQYPAAALLIDLMDPEVSEEIKRELPGLVASSTQDLMKLTYQLTKPELILPRPA